MNEYIPQFYEIIGKEQQTADTFLLKVKADRSYQPGQFFQVSILNMGEAPISVCSYQEGLIDLNIRDVGTVTHALCSLGIGDQIGIRGPYGKGYPMDLMKGNKIIIIAGGTGLSPVRGVIEYVEQHPKDYNGIKMFLGFRCPTEMLFKPDIEKWKKSFEVILTVDRCLPEDQWLENVGLVTNVLEKSNLDNKNKIVLVCGPPIMIKFVIQTLKKLGFNGDQIYLSLERMMSCGIQKCGNCLVGGKYICKDGPVFRNDEANHLVD
jgi:anaerobic sulfite reductase subunit B